ncbi:MAG: flagellar biosynthesis protein FlhA [Candidatus Solibacter sp.]|nr:flagellar biosynthesis protein FlhA [Candidatus Solibacter sp.]
MLPARVSDTATPFGAGGKPPQSPARTAAPSGGGSSSVQAGLRRLARGNVGVPAAVLGILLAMVMPLPAFLLDFLISANITLSTVVLLVSMHIRKPSEFSVFPTTLLLMTLFRLALNVSSSRLILLNGSQGTSAAGEVIESFGNFVVGGNFVIGVVIFLVLIAIQYVVINHGAVRISEVTARFTLDALPGKQMSIDADLNAGLINENEAKARRKALSSEAEFYGAMDGATRFTQRDAVASILITAINIVAGFLIGVFQHGLDMVQALETYTVLTIGDGLVTVIPALMISIAGGLIVTRAGSEDDMGSDFRNQVLNTPQPLLMASGALVAMGLFPGLPTVPFLLLGGGIGYAAWNLRTRQKAEIVRCEADARPAAPRENLEGLLRVEPLSIEVGLGLVKLVEGGANSPLLRRIAGIRRQMATQMGYLLPSVRVTDNLSLKVREYSVMLKGVELARYELMQGCELAIPPKPGAAPANASPAIEPAFGIPAFWIPSSQAERLRVEGYTVVDSISILGTHVSELVRRHAHEIFTRQDAKKVLDRVAEDNPKLVEDLVPKLVALGAVQKVFQNLLRERVSIRDAATILEALSEAAAVTRNPVLTTEYARQAIRRSVVQPYLNPNNELGVWFLDPGLEGQIERAVEHGEHASHLNLSPLKVREIVDAVSSGIGAAQGGAVILAGSGARYFLRQMIESRTPQAAVLSHGEVPSSVRVVSFGVLKGASTHE